MTLALIVATLVFPLFAPLSAPARLQQVQGSAPRGQARNADSQGVQNHMITVSRSGEAYAKPDLGILIMSIHSSSPIADEGCCGERAEGNGHGGSPRRTWVRSRGLPDYI